MQLTVTVKPRCPRYCPWEEPWWVVEMELEEDPIIVVENFILESDAIDYSQDREAVMKHFPGMGKPHDIS